MEGHRSNLKEKRKRQKRKEKNYYKNKECYDNQL